MHTSEYIYGDVGQMCFKPLDKSIVLVPNVAHRNARMHGNVLIEEIKKTEKSRLVN